MDKQSLRTDDCVDAVIEKYSTMIYRIALSNLKSRHDADDIFQEVFLRYFKNNMKFNNEDHIKAWFIRVTINCCKKYWSSSWVRKTEPLDDTLVFEMPEENLIHATLLELPAKYRSVLQLFYFEEMSVDEISKILKIKPATIRMQLTRGRLMIRDKLKGDYFDE
ncbi:MAG: polymerase sigma factor, sigma-70 family [Clostridiales bacterium]|jgi:RNA polymerase sigma-70 factor (ECF subfamily)|nr:polymerase sigma factor, sigma-70 family [Clostridiales bacterium]